MRKWQAPPIPFPPAMKRGDVRAIQHLMGYAAGIDDAVPSPETCKRAMDWIINEACKRYDIPFIANDPSGRNDAFMSGRMYVGKQITIMMELRPELIEE